ncbi:MAG: hypothetical protein Q7R88_01450 [bacterium]|nr:hypothetical protein [bacterium]
MESDTTGRKIVPASILIAAALIVFAVLSAPPPAADGDKGTPVHAATSFALPFTFGDLGAKLVSVGVVDREAFLSLYSGTAREAARRFLDGSGDEEITVTEENAGILLNLLWAAGLGNKSRILEQGEMMDPRYGGAHQFASTGGWTIARSNPETDSLGIAQGSPMEHYSRHPFALLTPEQEHMVDDVSRNMFRPCCDNSVHFPDCNHGMAMLGVLALMASEGKTEAELYEAGLAFNRMWFPEQYEIIETYAAQEGLPLDGKTLLGKTFASASGFQRVSRALTAPTTPKGNGGGGEGGGCSV